MNENLYANDQGFKHFSGVVDKTKKPSLVMFDDVNLSTITSDIPEGINMLLMRNMEGYLDIPFMHVRAKRMK